MKSAKSRRIKKVLAEKVKVVATASFDLSRAEVEDILGKWLAKSVPGYKVSKISPKTGTVYHPAADIRDPGYESPVFKGYKAELVKK